MKKLHDETYKRLFSNKALVESLLRDYVREDFAADMDFATLENCKASFVTDDQRTRMDDCVWKVSWRGQACCLCILLEFQSTPDPWMPVRIMVYTGLLWQDLIRTGVVRPGQNLPPVLPIVLYNGSRKWKTPMDIEALIADIPESLKKYQPRQSTFLLEEKRCALDSNGLMSLVAALEQAKDLDEAAKAYAKFYGMLEEEQYADLERLILGMIRNKPGAMGGDPPEEARHEEIKAMLKERIKEWEEEYIQIGRQEGREEGRQEGRQEGSMKRLADNIRSITAALGCTLEKAMELLNVSSEDRKKLSTML